MKIYCTLNAQIDRINKSGLQQNVPHHKDIHWPLNTLNTIKPDILLRKVQLYVVERSNIVSDQKILKK